MNVSRPVRWLIAGLVLMVILAGIAWLLVNNLSPHGTVMIDDMDFSDSALGWMIAVPILIGVGILLMVIFAGVGVVLAGALALVLGIAALGMLVAMIPVLLLLAVPLLALYGLVRLLSRPRASPAGSGTTSAT